MAIDIELACELFTGEGYETTRTARRSDLNDNRLCALYRFESVGPNGGMVHTITGDLTSDESVPEMPKGLITETVILDEQASLYLEHYKRQLREMC
jgi:hypothetical protein